MMKKVSRKVRHCCLFLSFFMLSLPFLKGQEKHNIVWFVLEDQSPQFFPMYGDSTIELPAMEALASESAIYENAYANVPVCAPARSSIILGMYPIKTATHNMRTFNAYNPDGEPAINVPSYCPVMPQSVMEFPKYLRAEGYYCTNNAKEDYNLKITDGTWDESSREAHWKNRPADSPFFAIFNFNECHESGIWRFGDDSLFVDPLNVEVPPYMPDNPVIRKDLAVNYSNLLRVDRKIEKLVAELKEAGLYDNTYIFVYGDHGGPFPRHKRSLYETGTKVPFFVKLPLSLSRGMERKEELINFIDLAPSVLSIAGVKKPEHMQGRAFLGQYLEEEPVCIFTSADRFDANYERRRAVRSGRFKLIKNFRTDLPYALPVEYRTQMPMMVKWTSMKEEGVLDEVAGRWMRDEKEEIEFYDIFNDPFELNNLADIPYYAKEKEALLEELQKWMDINEDKGRIDEQKLIAHWKTMSASTNLLKPLVKTNGQESVCENPNELGHLVYAGSGDDWKPYHQAIRLQAGDKIKVVHIGLMDSDVLIFE